MSDASQGDALPARGLCGAGSSGPKRRGNAELDAIPEERKNGNEYKAAKSEAQAASAEGRLWLKAWGSPRAVALAKQAGEATGTLPAATTRRSS
jgi:hypothetical protein